MHSLRKKHGLLLGACLFICIVVFSFFLYARHYSSDSDSSDDILRQEGSSSVPPTTPTEPESARETTPSVFGAVKDEVGNPLRGALVRAVHVVSDLYQYDVGAVETLHDGTYVHNGLTPEYRYRLVVSAPGFLSSSSKEFILEEKRTEINFALARSQYPDANEPEAPNEELLDAILSGAQESLD